MTLQGLFGVLLCELVPLWSVDAVGLPGEPHDDGDDGGLKEEHHPVGRSNSRSRQASEGFRRQQQVWTQEDGLHLCLDHVEFIEDGQKRAAVEPLVAVPPDVKATRSEPLRELTDIEDSRHHQPETVANEVDGGGAGSGERGRGGGVRRPGEEAVEDRRGGDEKREQEHKGSDEVSVLPPSLAGVAARQDADDGNKTSAGDVEGLKERSELWEGEG